MSTDLHSNLGNLRDFQIGSRQNHSKDSSSSLREWPEKSNIPSIQTESTAQDWEGIDLAKPLPRKQRRYSQSTTSLPTRQEIIVHSEGSIVGQDSSKWSVQLALDERRMDREGSVDYHNSYRKGELLKSKTAEYMQYLQQQMREQAEVFNSARQSPAHHVHVYKVSRTENDFMIFRNSVKMVISAQQAGKIFFAFNQYLGDLFAPGRKPVFEIQASWGALDQLYWSYRAERLDKEDVVRFFFSEFVQQSYR